MASNFHSELPNDQLHNPKDYSKANNSSALTKSDSGALDWVTSPYGTSTTITCGEDVAGGLHEKTFYIYLDSLNKAECYLQVTGEPATHVPTSGYLQVGIAIAANATAIKVADEIKANLDTQTGAWALALVTTVNGSGKITFSGMTDSPDTLDGDTNFFFENTKTYTGTTVLTSTAGDIGWLPGGGGDEYFVINGGGYVATTAEMAVSWGMSTGDSSQFTYVTTFLIPIGCRVVNVISQSQSTAGSTDISVYKPTAYAQLVSTSTPLGTVNVANHVSSVVYTSTFDSATYDFAAGDRLGVSVDSTTNLHGLSITVLLKKI